MSDYRDDAAHWEQFYRTHEFPRESSFARFVAGRLSVPTSLVELGCGGGQDSAFFASIGHHVVAMDRSAAGVEKARAKALSLKGGPIRFVVGDADDDAALAGVFSDPELREHGARPVALYARFFLHAVPQATEDAILNAAQRDLDGGFTLAAEFRTDRDAALPKAEGVHFRRFIATQDFAARLAARGFAIEHLEEGFGLSPYKDEDPHLCRVIARAPARR